MAESSAESPLPNAAPVLQLLSSRQTWVHAAQQPILAHGHVPVPPQASDVLLPKQFILDFNQTLPFLLNIRNRLSDTEIPLSYVHKYVSATEYPVVQWE